MNLSSANTTRAETPSCGTTASVVNILPRMKKEIATLSAPETATNTELSSMTSPKQAELSSFLTENNSR